MDQTTTPPVLPPVASAPVAAQALAVATPAQRKRAADAAEAFEAQMLSSLLQPMFAGASTSTKPPFGGGEAEQTYKSFMADAIAKQTAKAGGIGLAPVVMREMLKMQGLQ